MPVLIPPPSSATPTATPTTSAAAAAVFLLCFFFFFCAVSAFRPADEFFLLCGASSTVTLPDGRLFRPDSGTSGAPATLSAPRSVAISSTSSAAGASPLYRSARVFRLPSSYSFPLSDPTALFVLRLHFLPFSSSINLSAAVFDVYAERSSLLSRFSPPSTPVVKEFFLKPPNSSSFSPFLLSFYPVAPHSTAFVNAIELFSAPRGLVSDTFTPVPSSSSAALLTEHLLETLHRVNVGGSAVTPDNDTLWRNWVPDDAFLFTPAGQKAVAFSGKINYRNGAAATREIAPESVYGTAREISRGNSSNTSSPADYSNISWSFPVPDSSHGYFVRTHFCDIVSSVLGEFTFNVYINGYAAYKDLSFSSLTGFMLASPYYIDFLVMNSSGLGRINVSVGPSQGSFPSKINAILNGLEIMRIHGVVSFVREEKKDRHVGVLVASVLGSIVLIIVLLVLHLFALRRRRSLPNDEKVHVQNADNWSPLPVLTGNSNSIFTEPTSSCFAIDNNPQLRMSFSEILLATNGFSDNAEIGSGGFGKVYKGLLRNGTKIAVKRGSPGSQQGRGEFHTEIEVLSKIRHNHLVALIGYCQEQCEMIIVYEFMEKGPLRDHLYGRRKTHLSWKQRLEICIGAARGLHYLHTGSAQGIIHRDIKSSNILLDENYTAKVADFGLSKLGTSQTHVSTSVKGSFGYLDPEYFKTQQLTDKSDVYSFGVVLLEVICARPVIDQSLPWEQVNLAEWAMKWQKKHLLEKIIDPALNGKIDQKSLRKFGEIVERCLAQYGIDRPTMGDVLWSLENIMQLQGKELKEHSYGDSATGPFDTSLT